MKNHKPDKICNKCIYQREGHRCWYTAKTGDYFVPPKSGRIGLSKDGLSCKYFVKKKDLK